MKQKLFSRKAENAHCKNGKARKRRILFNSGGIPMKRTPFVIICTVCKTSLVSCNRAWHIFKSPMSFRRGEKTKFSKFFSSIISFRFRNRNIILNALHFRIEPFKELLFFKRFMSEFQFHIGNVCAFCGKVNNFERGLQCL